MKKTVLIVILVLALGTGAYLGYSYWWDATTYFTTDNASVSANMITITPLISGTVASWDVREGDEVAEGQVLGKQNLESLIQSSAMSPQSLNQTAGSNVSKAEIKTPISGKVVQSNVVIGEAVAPSMQLAVVADTSNMYIKANVEESDINRIAVGQEVDVSIDAYPDVRFKGFVESIGEATQSAFSTMPSLNTSGTFTKVTQLVPVRVNVAGIENYKLRLGYNATVKIKTN